MEAFDILILEQCAAASRMGMLDKGFPRRLGLLATKGLVEKIKRPNDEGYRITEDGIIFLQSYHREETHRRQEKKARRKDRLEE